MSFGDAVVEEKVVADRAPPFKSENPSFFEVSNDREEGEESRLIEAATELEAKNDGEREEGVTKALVAIDATKQ